MPKKRVKLNFYKRKNLLDLKHQRLTTFLDIVLVVGATFAISVIFSELSSISKLILMAGIFAIVSAAAVALYQKMLGVANEIAAN
jgi:arginine exporter protein ArgO